MTTTPADRKGFAWLGSVTAMLAMIACYGTLAVVALLSVIGISVEINEGLMVKLISGLLVLVLAGMGYSWRLHRNPGPLLLSIAATIVLIWVFYGSYSKPLELAGFLMLAIASIWDFRTRKRICKAQSGE